MRLSGIHTLLLTCLLLAGPSIVRAEPSVAFVGVNVVTMENRRVLANRTVLVTGDRIAAVGKTGSVRAPETATTIEGRGRYLMPGLADMHVHVWSPGDLTVYVANGVTTIRNMFGSPMHLQWRKDLAAGKTFGPTLFTAGPIIDGEPPVWPGSVVVETIEKAAEVVASQKAAGYDFLKVYTGLSREVYDAILAAAAEHGMPVVGHVPTVVSLTHALATGQRSIEHLTGYGVALLDETVKQEDSRNRRWIGNWIHADADKIGPLARQTREAGTWICPTLGVFDGIALPIERRAGLLSRPEMRFVPAQLLMFWNARDGDAELFGQVRAGDANRDRVTRALWKAGVPILLGTDCPNPFLVPGFSIHGELEHLVDAGLSPYEALRAGTRNAAEFVGGLDEFGTVAEGKRADLILLEANPLEDVAHLERRVGVMLRGRWLPESELKERLEKVARSYGR